MNSPLLFKDLQLNADLDEIWVVEVSGFFSIMGRCLPPSPIYADDGPGLLCWWQQPFSTTWENTAKERLE